MRAGSRNRAHPLAHSHRANSKVALRPSFAAVAWVGARGRALSAMGSPDPQTTLNFMREQCQELAIKINQMDLDKTEHELVMKALEPLDPDRKCFRMIGNVVVERTVGEVLPAVLKNRDQVRRPRRSRSAHAQLLPPPPPSRTRGRRARRSRGRWTASPRCSPRSRRRPTSLLPSTRSNRRGGHPRPRRRRPTRQDPREFSSEMPAPVSRLAERGREAACGSSVGTTSTGLLDLLVCFGRRAARVTGRAHRESGGAVHTLNFRCTDASRAAHARLQDDGCEDIPAQQWRNSRVLGRPGFVWRPRGLSRVESVSCLESRLCRKC